MYSNRKKLRGWRRRLRATELWRDTASRLDIDALMRREALWVKIPLDPWNRLARRDPPMWYRRIVLTALVTIHERWHAQLVPLGIPFVLRICLLHPRFHSSQVVAAIGSKLDYYARLFLHFPDDDPAPIDIYTAPGLSLDGFTWKAGIDFDPVFEDGYDLTPEEVARYAASAFHVDRDGDDTVYLLDRGTAWVGARRERMEDGG